METTPRRSHSWQLFVEIGSWCSWRDFRPWHLWCVEQCPVIHDEWPSSRCWIYNQSKGTWNRRRKQQSHSFSSDPARRGSLDRFPLRPHGGGALWHGRCWRSPTSRSQPIRGIIFSRSWWCWCVSQSLWGESAMRGFPSERGQRVLAVPAQAPAPHHSSRLRARLVVCGSEGVTCNSDKKGPRWFARSRQCAAAEVRCWWEKSLEVSLSENSVAWIVHQAITPWMLQECSLPWLDSLTNIATGRQWITFCVFCTQAFQASWEAGDTVALVKKLEASRFASRCVLDVSSSTLWLNFNQLQRDSQFMFPIRRQIWCLFHLIIWI